WWSLGPSKHGTRTMGKVGRVDRGSSRIFGVAGNLGFEPFEHLLQRCDLGFELLHPLRQFIRWSARRRQTFGEGDPDLAPLAPLHMGAQRLFLLRDVELDDVGHVDGLGEDQPRTVVRDVADQAVHHRAAPVEIAAAAQGALLAGRSSSFAHSEVSGINDSSSGLRISLPRSSWRQSDEPFEMTAGADAAGPDRCFAWAHGARLPCMPFAVFRL